MYTVDKMDDCYCLVFRGSDVLHMLYLLVKNAGTTVTSANWTRLSSLAKPIICV